MGSQDRPGGGRAAITVVRAGALGDFVVTLPALRALAVLGRPIDFVGNASTALALAPERFASVVSIDDPAWLGLFDDAVRLHPGTGAAVALLHDPDVATRLARAGWAPVLAAPPFPRDEPDRHVAEHLLGVVAPLAGAQGVDRLPRLSRSEARSDDECRPALTPRVPTPAATVEVSRDARNDRCKPTVEPTPEARRAGRDQLAELGVEGPYAVLHPGSGSRWKNWPADRFASVARQLVRRGVAPVALAGAADEEVVKTMVAAFDGDLPLVRGVPLDVLAAVLAEATLYVGNDSGVSHVAGAVGAPTIALFGPTRAARWKPWGPSVVAIEPVARCAVCRTAEERPVACRCVEAIPLERVLAAADEMLETCA